MSKNNKNKLVQTLRFPEFAKEDDWVVKPLNKLGKLVNGLTYSPDDVKESGLLVLRSSNIQNGENVLDDNVYVRTDVKGVNLSEPNDILICVRNGSKALIGKNALIPTGMPLCTHGAFMTVFRSDKSKFIFQLFQTTAYAKKVAGDLGATINSINGSNFLKYEFLVPKNPEEQNKIADFLSSVDDVIKAERQKLNILQNHKKGLLQNLLPQAGETIPKFRFKEFEDSSEWVESSLTQVADYENGKAHEQDISDDGEFIVVNSKFISQDGEVKKFTNTAFLPATKGDILMVLSDIPNGKAIAKCFFVEADNRYTVNQRICRITPRNVNSKILYYLLNRNPYFLAFDDGVKQTNLRKDDVLNCPLLIPEDPKEQEKIAETLSSVDDLINSQNQKLEALQLHKKGMLQGLFPNINDIIE